MWNTQWDKERNRLYASSFKDTGLHDPPSKKHAEMHKFNELYQHELANQPREYANGGISNHFRKKFDKGSDYGQFERRQAHNVAAGSQAMNVGGGQGNQGNQGGGGGPKPHSGPSFAEIEAQKKAAAAAEAARLQALENARSKQMYDTTMAKRAKNIKYYDKNLKSKFDTSTGDTDTTGLAGLNLNEELASLGFSSGATDENIQLAKALNIENLLKGDWSKEKIDKSKFEKGLGDAIGYNKAWKNVPEDITKGQFIKDALDKKYGNMGSAVLEKAIQKGGVFPSEVLDQFPKSSLVYGSKVKPTVKYDEGKMFIDVDEGELESDALGALTKKGWLAKGGVARKNYYHGGILDINESEEIISDDGNHIELTAYNAEFDDPKDLSTGVKTLFQAKDGGTPQLAKKSKDGSRPGYGNPFGYEDAPAHHGDVAHGPGGRFDQPSGPVSKPQTVPSGINIHQDTGKEEEAYEMVGGQKLYESSWGTGADPREKYDTEKEMLTGIYGTTKKGINTKHAYTTGRTKAAYELALKNQKAKMKSMGKGKLIPALIAFVVSGFNPAAAMSTFKVSKIDMLNIVKDSIPVMKAKKAHITALEDAKKELLGLVDINNPNEMVNLEETTDFTKIMNELKDLTKPREQEDDDRGGPELPPQLGGPSTEEMAREYGMSNLERIRAAQALREQINPDWQLTAEAKELKNNPIVSGTETDIIAIGNKGGLANLFRVKNQ